MRAFCLCDMTSLQFVCGSVCRPLLSLSTMHSAGWSSRRCLPCGGTPRQQRQANHHNCRLMRRRRCFYHQCRSCLRQLARYRYEQHHTLRGAPAIRVRVPRAIAQRLQLPNMCARLPMHRLGRHDELLHLHLWRNRRDRRRPSHLQNRPSRLQRGCCQQPQEQR